MARTNSDNVKGLLMDDYGARLDGSSPSLTPFIDSATVVIDRVDACATAKGWALTAAELELLERWLAAHMYCMSDQQLMSKNTLAAGATFRAQGGLNLNGSTYGQTAVALDPSGCLAAIGLRKTAGMEWLGKPPSEQTAYEDRD